jgi:hypothetical protein
LVLDHWSQLLIEAHGFGQVLCCTLHSAFFLNPVTPGCTCAFCFLAVSGFWTCCTGFVHHASWPAPIPIFYCPGPSPSLLLVVLFLIWFSPSTLVSCLEFVSYLFGNYLEVEEVFELRTSLWRVTVMSLDWKWVTLQKETRVLALNIFVAAWIRGEHLALYNL